MQQVIPIFMYGRDRRIQLFNRKNSSIGAGEHRRSTRMINRYKRKLISELSFEGLI